MSKKKAPFFKLYPADLISDPEVAAMTNAQLGGYIRLLCYQWLNPNCLIPLKDVSKLSRLKGESLQVVLERFTHLTSNEVRSTGVDQTTNAVRQDRLFSEFEKMREISQKRSSSGKKGNEVKYQDVANATQEREKSETEVRGQSLEDRDFSFYIDELKNQFTIKESIIKILRTLGYQITPEQYFELLDIFAEELKIDQPAHQNLKEVTSHFKNWIKKQFNQHQRKTQSHGKRTTTGQKLSRLEQFRQRISEN